MKMRIFLLFISLFAMAVVVHGATPLQSGIIKDDGVNLRAEPSTFGQILSVLQLGLPVTIMEQSNRWYKVQLQNGLIGWTFGQFIEFKSLAPVNSRESFIALPVKMITYAKNFLGVKYVYGGDSPQSFDCSGFTID